MRHPVFLFLWITLVVSFFLGAAAADQEDWVGVWRVTTADPSAQQSVFHLAVSRDGGQYSVEYYDHLWRRYSMSRFQFEGDQAEFDSPIRSKSFRLKLTREGDRLSGTSELLHPQYKWSTELTGFRVVSRNQWEPFAGLNEAQEEGLVDINAILLSEAPFESFEAFEKVWTEKVEQPFYVAVANIVYGAGGGLEERQENLRALFETVQQEGYSEFARKVARLRGEVLNRLKEEDLFFKNVFIPMPSKDSFASSAVVWQESFAIRWGTDLLYERAVDDEHLRAWIAREQLELPFYREFPPSDQSLSAQLLRGGLAAHLAVDLGLAETPYQCALRDLEADSVDLESVRQRMIENPRQVELSEAEILALGTELADRILAITGRDGVLAMTKDQFLEYFANFLQSG